MDNRLINLFEIYTINEDTYIVKIYVDVMLSSYRVFIVENNSVLRVLSLEDLLDYLDIAKINIDEVINEDDKNRHIMRFVNSFNRELRNPNNHTSKIKNNEFIKGYSQFLQQQKIDSGSAFSYITENDEELIKRVKYEDSIIVNLGKI